MVPKRVVVGLNVFIVLVPLLALSGWLFNVVSLVSITANMTAMNPLTAVTFLLLSLWAYLHRRGAKGYIRAALKLLITSFVLLVGAMKLLEYAHISDVHFDQWLFADKLKSKLLHNAIAPTTSLLFVFAGLLLLNTYLKARCQKITNDVLLVFAFLISYLGTVGYIFSMEPFYRVGPFVPMALNTALCFIALFLLLFVILKPAYLARVFFSVHIGGKLARRAIPLMLLIPPVFGYFRLFVHRAYAYNTEYGIVLDTGFILLLIISFIYYYASALNRNDFRRKKAEAEVIQNEERYRSLVFAMKEGVVYYDKDNLIVFYNDSFAKMTGYAPGEIIGRQFIDVFVDEDKKQRSYQRLAERKKGFQEDYDLQILHKDGTKIWVAINARSVMNNGMATAFFATFTDITERKKKEEDLEAFSGSAAHDLNAPLARIEALADIVLESNRGVLSVDDVEFLEAIHKTTVDTRAMLKDLLAFSKVGVGKLRKVHISNSDLVMDVVKNGMHINPAAVINISDLPDAEGDKLAVKQVWTNLIFNALKYSSKTGKPVIHIGSYIDGDKVIYTVKDNGAGFDMADAAKLFAPFQRLHGDFEGNGLGLPIVKRIVEKHGGKIWAESKVNEGATFFFTL